MRQYAKTAAQVVVTILVAIAAVWTNGITTAEWINIAIVAAGALGVFTAPNVPGAAYTKSILAAITAGLVVASSAITGGISVPEWIQIVIAAAGAVGVYAVSNKPSLGVRK